jgi:hypothetical protein
MSLPLFDFDFAGPAQWAAMYRACGLQIIPGYMPGEARGGAWKRPMLSEWRTLQEQLVPDDTFARWYHPQTGEHRLRPNMGILAGRCSGNVFVIDMDVHKKPEAMQWWRGVMAVHNADLDLETVEQRTGGGGLQKLFRAPMGWPAPTNKTPIGVDIRGQGGFAVMAPSQHESGKEYQWLQGRAPWEVEILEAPSWLLDEVSKLVAAHGGQAGHAQQTPRHAQSAQYDAWGRQTDDRETYMTQFVWGVMLDWRRECPIEPTEAEAGAKAAEKYPLYEAKVRPQLKHPDGWTLTEQLEAEGRGPSAFWAKMKHALRHWGDKVTEEAAQANPKAKAGTYDWRKDFDTGGQGGGGGGGSTGAHQGASAAGQGPLILTGKQFMEGFVPPDYLVEGVIQRGYLYSITARTGHGKTAVGMRLMCHVAQGTAFHGKRCEQGGVLFMAGENPQDIRARYQVLADAMAFDIDTLPVHFVDGVIDIAACMAQIRDEAEKIDNLSMIMVDTKAAFFFGDEGNNNEQQMAFARMLRALIKIIPSHPTILVVCHPVKNATEDNLVPLGGSAFLNEVDANLTLWAEDKIATLGPHADKWRGVTFESMAFELRTVTSERLKDAKGREIPSVVALPVTEIMAERQADVATENGKTAMRLIHTHKGISITGIAKAAGWIWPDGSPAKSKAQKVCDKLRAAKLIGKAYGNKLYLTRKGAKVIEVKFDDGEDDDD